MSRDDGTLDLFDPSRRKSRGSSTSKEAFQSVPQEVRDGQQREILALIASRGVVGLTLDEACEELGYSPNQISGRFFELYKKGLVFRKAKSRRDTRGGRRAKISVSREYRSLFDADEVEEYEPRGGG